MCNSVVAKTMLIGLMFTHVIPSNLYAASVEEFDDIESTLVAEQLQEQPELYDFEEQQTEFQESSDITAVTDTNDADTDDAYPSTVNIEELLTQAVAQPQPRTLFNRYALCSTSSIRTIQQFVAEQIGSLAASFMFVPPTKMNGRLQIKGNTRRAIVKWTYYGLRYVQRMINFASLVDSIEASLETEITTPHAEIHTKAFKDGLPLAAASALAAFLSTAMANSFYFWD